MGSVMTNLRFENLVIYDMSKTDNLKATQVESFENLVIYDMSKTIISGYTALA